MASLNTFCDEATGLVDQGSTADVAYPDFGKTGASVSPKILLEKLLKCGLDEQRGAWKTGCMARPRGC